MQTSELEEFEAEIGKLCAGFEVPVTKHRKDAYWSGLRKMSLAQFSRCVEFALSEEGPEDFPGTKTIWKIHRQLRAPGAPGVHTSARAAEPDHLTYWANRLLYAHITARGGLGSGKGLASAELTACLKLKREQVAWFTGPVREGDPDCTPAEFLRQWIAGLQAISRIEKSTYDRWCAMLEQPDMEKPFEPSMGRELAPVQPELPEFA